MTFRRCSRLCWTFKQPQCRPADTAKQKQSAHATTWPAEGNLPPCLEEPPAQNLSPLIRDFAVKSHIANCSIWHKWAKSTACLHTGGGIEWMGQRVTAAPFQTRIDWDPSQSNCSAVVLRHLLNKFHRGDLCWQEMMQDLETLRCSFVSCSPRLMNLQEDLKGRQLNSLSTVEQWTIYLFGIGRNTFFLQLLWRRQWWWEAGSFSQKPLNIYLHTQIHNGDESYSSLTNILLFER